MPHYWFDMSDNGTLTRDEEGLEFQDLHSARAEALRALGDLLREKAVCDVLPEFVIVVRDESGTVCRISLALRVEA